MQIIISTKNISLDDPLEIFIQEKIGSLKKFINNDNAVARVEIGKPSRHHRSGMVFYAEANLKIGSKLIRAEATDDDLRRAIVKVKDELQTQIKKFKEKPIDKSIKQLEKSK